MPYGRIGRRGVADDMRHNEFPADKIFPSYRSSKEKKVSFATRDDVTYIYPWSPVKYLLYGKFSDEQLNRGRTQSDNIEFLPSILKKTKCNLVKETTDRKQIQNADRKVITEPECFEQRLQNGRTRSVLDALGDVIIPNILLDADTPPVLEEIKFEDTPQQLPNVVTIFSPSNEKDPITNDVINDSNDVIRKQNSPFPSRHKEKFHPSNITREIQRTIKDHAIDCLPQLPNTSPSECISGCIGKSRKNDVTNIEGSTPRRYLPMQRVDSLYVTPTKRTTIASQISKRYAITEPDLHDVLDLNEEDFGHRVSDRGHGDWGVFLPALTPSRNFNRNQTKVKSNKKNRTTTKPVSIDVQSNTRRKIPKIPKPKSGRVYTKGIMGEVKGGRRQAMTPVPLQGTYYYRDLR